MFTIFDGPEFKTPLAFNNETFFALSESEYTTVLIEFDLLHQKYKEISVCDKSDYSLLLKGNEIIYSIQKK